MKSCIGKSKLPDSGDGYRQILKSLKSLKSRKPPNLAQRRKKALVEKEDVLKSVCAGEPSSCTCCTCPVAAFASSISTSREEGFVQAQTERRSQEFAYPMKASTSGDV